MEATRVRELIGEAVLALKECGLWGMAAAGDVERIRAGHLDGSAQEFAAWMELVLLPRIATALAATERPEPVDGLGIAARTAFGEALTHQRLIGLVDELEQALSRAALSTELDEALAGAESSAEAADRFYSTFANTLLIVPLDEVLEADGSVRVEPEDEFTPLLTELDGIQYLAVFDREERLLDWAGSVIPHTSMTGMALALALAPAAEIHVALNPGSGHEKVFIPDELEELRQQVMEVEDGVFLAPAGNIPDVTVEALRTVLASLPVVRSAHLAVRLGDSDADSGRLVVAIALTPGTDAAVTAHVNALLVPVLAEHACEVLLSGRDPLVERIVERVPPVFEVV